MSEHEHRIVTMLQEALERLERIDRRLQDLETTVAMQGAKIMSALDDLTKQVAANTSVENSAVLLIQGIAAQLAAAGTDPAKLAALTTQLNASAVALAKAVSANTPAPVPGPTGGTGATGGTGPTA